MQVRNLLSIAVFTGAVLGLVVAQRAGDSVKPGGPLVAASAVAAPPGTLSRASEVIGATVYGRNGAELGSVRDLVLGPSGQVVGLVVGIGGFFGLGGKQFAVSFSQAEIVKSHDGSLDGVRLDLSHAQAESAPPFTGEYIDVLQAPKGNAPANDTGRNRNVM